MKRHGRRGRGNQEQPPRTEDVVPEEENERQIKQMKLFEAAGIDSKLVLDMSEEEREGTLKALLESTGQADNSQTYDCLQIQENDKKDGTEILDEKKRTSLTTKVITRQQNHECTEDASVESKAGSSSFISDKIKKKNEQGNSHKVKRKVRNDRSRAVREMDINTGIIQQFKYVTPEKKERDGSSQENPKDTISLNRLPCKSEDLDKVSDSDDNFQTDGKLKAGSNDLKLDHKKFDCEKKRQKRNKGGENYLKNSERNTPASIVPPVDKDSHTADLKWLDAMNQESNLNVSHNQVNLLMTKVPDSASENSTNSDSGQFRLDFEETQAPEHPILTNNRSESDSDESDLPSISGIYTKTGCLDADTQAPDNTLFIKERDIESDDSSTPHFAKLEQSKNEMLLNENCHSADEETQGCNLHQENVLATNTDSEIEEDVNLLLDVDEVPDSQVQSCILRQEVVSDAKLSSVKHLFVDNSGKASEKENLPNQDTFSLKMQYWPPMFLPNQLTDPENYTQVIKLIFNIYHRQLRHSLKMLPGLSTPWGKPVKPGPHEQDCLKAKWRTRGMADGRHLFDKGLRSLRKNKDACPPSSDDDDSKFDNVVQEGTRKRHKKNDFDSQFSLLKQDNNVVKNDEIIEGLAESSDNEQMQPSVRKRSLRTKKQEIFTYKETSTQGEDDSDTQISDSNWELETTENTMNDLSKHVKKKSKKLSKPAVDDIDVHDWITKKPPIKSYENVRGVKFVKKKTEKPCKKSNLSLKFDKEDDGGESIKNKASVYDFFSESQGELSGDSAVIPSKRLKINSTKFKPKGKRASNSVSDEEDITSTHECTTSKDLKTEKSIQINSTLFNEDYTKKEEEALNNSQGIQGSGLPISQGSNFLLDVNGDMYGTQFPQQAHKGSHFKDHLEHQKKPQSSSQCFDKSKPHLYVFDENKEDSYKRDIPMSSKSDMVTSMSHSKINSDTVINTSQALITEKSTNQTYITETNQGSSKDKNSRKRKQSSKKRIHNAMPADSALDAEICRKQQLSLQNIESETEANFVNFCEKIHRKTEDEAEDSNESFLNKNMNNSERIHNVVYEEQSLLNPLISIEAESEQISNSSPGYETTNIKEGLCPICDQMFPFKELEEHASTCGEENRDPPLEPKTDKCLICNVDIATGKMRVHQMHCIKQFSPDPGTRKTRYGTGMTGLQVEKDNVGGENCSEDD